LRANQGKEMHKRPEGNEKSFKIEIKIKAKKKHRMNGKAFKGMRNEKKATEYKKFLRVQCFSYIPAMVEKFSVKIEI
jgi:hypothetical protein